MTGSVCPFCSIAAGDDDPRVESRQSDVFYRDDEVIGLISAGWWPNNPGSALIVPSRHYRNIYDIPPAVYAAVNELGRLAGIAMKREYGAAGISFRQHNEAAGGQSVDHYHLWVFPRYPSDRLYELYAQGATVPIESRAQYARRMARRFALGDLVARFLSCRLSHAEWTHEAHLSVGLWHVHEYGAEEALTRLREGIRRLNDSHGTPNSDTRGYHETITRAYVELLSNYDASCPPAMPLSERVARLLASPLAAKDALARFYSRDLLMSTRARSAWVEPDLAPLDKILNRDAEPEPQP